MLRKDMSLFVLIADTETRSYKVCAYANNEEEAQQYARNMLEIYSHTDTTELLEADEERKSLHDLAHGAAHVNSVTMPAIIAALNAQRPESTDASPSHSYAPKSDEEVANEVARKYKNSFNTRKAEAEDIRGNSPNIKFKDIRELRGNDIYNVYHGRRWTSEHVSLSIFSKEEKELDSFYLTQNNLLARISRLLTNQDINNIFISGNKEDLTPKYASTKTHFWNQTANATISAPDLAPGVHQLGR